MSLADVVSRVNENREFLKPLRLQRDYTVQSSINKTSPKKADLSRALSPGRPLGSGAKRLVFNIPINPFH